MAASSPSSLGCGAELPPSQRYTLLANALALVDDDRFDQIQRLRWCGYCVREPGTHDLTALKTKLTG